jgi:hypothetical protein
MNRTRLGPKLARGAIVAGVFTAATFVAVPAQAYYGLPEHLKNTYNLSCTPECTFCHKSNLGGKGNERDATTPNGTAKTGFVATLRDIGRIVATNPSTWVPAFNLVESSRSDTDLDGTPDIEELKVGSDPMDASPAASICGGGGGPTYGCVRVARGTSVDGFALVASGAVLFAGIALTRRRRR